MSAFTAAAEVCLVMLALPGVGPRSVASALDGLGPSPDLREAIERLGRTFGENNITDAQGELARIKDESRRAGVSCVAFVDADYPQRLRADARPPVVLHYLGRLSAAVDSPAAAVIGTREPTAFGRETARAAGAQLARDGVTVVSGLATGCDAEAHTGCVEAGGYTVAAMAHGLDRVYPASNRALASEILKQGGCLVSEYAVGRRPFRSSFVERDRIQSALSSAILVIETGIKGGSLHTVDFARKQGRPVYCVEHPLHLRDETKAQGNARLLKDGVARPVDAIGGLAEFSSAVRALARPEGTDV